MAIWWLFQKYQTTFIYMTALFAATFLIPCFTLNGKLYLYYFYIVLTIDMI